MKVELSGTLQRMSGYVREHEIDADSARAALQELVRRFPGLDGILMDREGKVRQAHCIFLNSTRIFDAEMDQPVQPDDKLEVITAIAGG